jgi:hypothetical protein
MRDGGDNYASVASSVSAGAGQVPADTIEKALSAAREYRRLQREWDRKRPAGTFVGERVEQAGQALDAALAAVRTPEEKAT